MHTNDEKSGKKRVLFIFFQKKGRKCKTWLVYLPVGKESWGKSIKERKLHSQERKGETFLFMHTPSSACCHLCSPKSPSSATAPPSALGLTHAATVQKRLCTRSASTRSKCCCLRPKLKEKSLRRQNNNLNLRNASKLTKRLGWYVKSSKCKMCKNFETFFFSLLFSTL